MKKKYFIFIALLVLIVSLSTVSANDLNETDDVSDDIIDEGNDKLQVSGDFEDSKLTSEDDEIVVNDWSELQYYCSLNDKNYTLRLKENTNFYPNDPSDSSYQILVKNSVRIIGSEGSYIGDASSSFRNITYTAITIPDNSGIGITLENITFKWIGTSYNPDGVFLCMGGDVYNYIRNCYFTEISTNLGHSSILHIKWGDAVLENCTFINCTNEYGCLSVYNPLDDVNGLCTRARMEVINSYFEGNYARTEPGCINNCGVLVVRNSTFYKNSAFWWAGAIHTHSGANTTIYDSNFTDNLAGWNGGALFTYSYLQVFNTIFKGNNCTTNYGGGAIGTYDYLHSPFIYIVECIFEDNENLCWAPDELSDGVGRGGAISFTGKGIFELYNSTLIKNSAAIGSAISIMISGDFGSPNVVIVGNKFYNHTRIGDVLDIRLSAGSTTRIEDNYYYNNSIVFSKLRLVVDEQINNEAELSIQAALENPSYYDEDILDKSEYDVYVDGEFVKRVIGRTFTLNIEEGKVSSVYVVPCISTSRSNEVLIGKEKEYIYVSQKYGNDNYNGLTRNTPVKTLAHAIELARNYENILIMDGSYSESNLVVDYDLAIVGEDNVIISGTNNKFVVNNSVFSIKNLNIKNAHRSSSSVDSKHESFIQQLNDSGFVEIDGCSFISNEYSNIIKSQNSIEIKNSVFNDNTGTIIYTVTLNMDNCSFIHNTASNAPLIDGINVKDWSISNSNFENSYNLYKGIIVYSPVSVNNKLNIINDSFIGNSVKSGTTTVYSSGIYIAQSATVNIVSSVFMNNFDRGNRANLIYFYSASTTTVRNSIFLNNTCDNDKGIIFEGRNSLKNRGLNCDYNWFGNTMDDLTRPNLYEYIVCNNWLVLNINSNTTSLGLNQKALINANVNCAVDSEGVISNYSTTNFPVLPVTFTATNGELNSSVADLVDGNAQVEFTLNNLDDAVIKANVFGKEASITFKGEKVIADIVIEVENVTYGNDASIHFILPDEVALVDLSLRIDGKSYDVNEYVTVSNLSAGPHLIELNYSGNYRYEESSYNKSFEVYKASPILTIDVNSSYYGEESIIDVYVTPQVTGEISIDVGGETQRKEISNGKASFTFNNLAADNYTAIVTYLGNQNYSDVQNTANFTVRKYNTITNVNYNLIADEFKVILDINVDPQVSGNLTVSVNHNGAIDERTVAIDQGHLSYTINNLEKGDYQIDVTYIENSKYLSSKDTVNFELNKAEPSFNVNVRDIDYGQTAIIEITLNDDAEGTVNVLVDDRNITVNVTGVKTEVQVSGLSAGDNKKVEVFYSGDRNYKNASETTYFNISKIAPYITIDANDIKVGFDLDIKFSVPRGVTGTINATCGDNNKILTINSFMGTASWKLQNLDVGNYTITAIYSGDGNYLTNQTSLDIKVSAWDVPQWANEGGDITNTGKSPYETAVNGEILWFSNIDGTITGNMAIDFEGNIYVNVADKIYSFDKNGNKRWEFSIESVIGNISGIAIGYDEVIAPKSGDTLYFINLNGTRFGNSNIYKASSIYPPIVDGDGNVYTVSEFQYNEGCYCLVIVPYSLWENGGNPIWISLGRSQPVASPTIIDNRYVAVSCRDGLKIVDILSKSIVSSMPGAMKGARPVVGPGNIVYAVVGDSIVAIDSNFNQIWKTKVTGGVGKYLALDEEQGLFAVNANGDLYKYNLITGGETLICDLQITSGILIGNDGKLYVGAGNAFYALDTNGDKLWKVNTQDTIIGNPVMDKNGIIYLTSQNNIYALTNAPLKDSMLNVSVGDIEYGENQTITITLDDEATGNMLIKVIGENYTLQLNEIANKTVILNIANLSWGNYDVTVIYSGDEKFKPDETMVDFKVNKVMGKSSITVFSISGDGYLVSILKDDAGNPIANAKVTYTLNKGANQRVMTNEKGEFTIIVVDNSIVDMAFEGNEFNEASTASITLKNIFPKQIGTEIIAENPFTRTAVDYKAGERGYMFYFTLKDENGNLLPNKQIKIGIDGKIYTVTTDKDGKAGQMINMPSENSYTYALCFLGDDDYKASFAVSRLIVVKKAVTITPAKTSYSFTSTAKTKTITATLKSTNSYIPKGKQVTLTIAGKTFKATIGDKGQISFNIGSVTKKGTYKVAIVYAGDVTYKAATSSTITVKIS